MKKDEGVELKLPNSLAALTELHAVAGEFCRQWAIHPDIAFKVDLVLDELFTNIVRYGYDDNGFHEIVVRFKGGHDRIRISIEDDARHFNPLLAPEVDIDAPASERRIGGLGIHLVRNLMDQVRYQRRPVGNRLIVIKRLGKEEKQI